ncbi:hypothetical protein ABQJ54_13055 [Rhodanobacter sp. Si-c]|uniref:Uncharacterized protein n=1 Tax=Rhodanobacter lycopersici TaxID=3162487 RepID=A0ABV3QGU3_9GAMM
MDLFGGIEKLITEHGSAAILRERIGLAAQQYAILEKENASLKVRITTLEAENSRLQEQARSVSSSSNPSGYVCDHCGSPDLKRTGSRADPTFGDLGIKQALFSCNSCGKQSAFTP